MSTFSKLTLAPRTILPAALLSIVGACGGTPRSSEVVSPGKEEPTKEPQVDPRYASLPTPKPAPAWTPPQATKTTLTNGLTVWQMGGATAPLVSIHLMLPTGGATDPPGKAGLTLLAADMLDEGAGKMSALELSDKLGELATDFEAQAGVDYVLLSMDGIAENLQENLRILADIVRRPLLSPAEFDRRKKHHEATALASREDPSASRSKAIGRILFGTGYAGSSPSGTLSTIESITLADVKKQVARMTIPDGAHLTIAGAIDPETTLQTIEGVFGDWKGKWTPPATQVKAPDSETRAYVIDFPGATQSVLGVVTQAGSDDDPNYFAEEVMNEKLGHSFTSRINMNLREDKGYTYGAFSVFRRYRKAGYFGIVTNVKSETTGDSIREIQAELAAVCKDRPLTQKERDEAVEGLLLGFPLQFDEVSSLGLRLVTLPIHGRPVDFWSTWPERIRDVSTERANEAAKPFCDLSRYQIVVAGDASSTTQQLQALGMPVSLLDRDGNPLEQPQSTQKPH
jgi:zinc protease